MARFMVSEQAHTDPRIAVAGNAAAGLWVRTGAWASKNGPSVPDAVMRVLGTRRQRDALAGVGLIEQIGPGQWQVAKLAICRSHRDEDGRPLIPPVVRAAVYARDEYRCRHCGTFENLSIDHIHPRSKGGADSFDNYQTLCRPCNSRKGARLELEVP